MKQIFQIGRFVTYFLVGLLACYCIVTAIAYGKDVVFLIFPITIYAFIGALFVGLVGGLIAVFRSRPRSTGHWSWRLKAGLSWLAGGIIGGVLLSLLLTTPLLISPPSSQSPMDWIIKNNIVCPPTDHPESGCRKEQFSASLLSSLLLPLLIGALGAIASGEIARRRYVRRGRSAD